MEYKTIRQKFVNLFNEYSKKHFFEHNFYDLSAEDKFEIAKDTFYDIADVLKNKYPNVYQYTDNIIVSFQKIIG